MRYSQSGFVQEYRLVRLDVANPCLPDFGSSVGPLNFICSKVSVRSVVFS